MNKTKRLVIIIVFLLLSVSIFSLYHIYKVAYCFELANTPEILAFYADNRDYDDMNVVSLITRNFFPNKETKGKIQTLSSVIPSQKDLFNEEIDQKVIEETKNIIPNNIDIFKNSFIKYNIREKIIRTKSLEKDLIEYRRSARPLPITVETTKAVATFWYLLSRYFANQKDFDNSLFLSHGILYLSRKFERGSCYGLSALTRTHTKEITHIGCRSILIWASKPKPNSSSLTKELAYDILDLVNSEFPLSLNVNFEFDEMNKILDESSLKNDYTRAYEILYHLSQTSTYTSLVDIIYKQPLNFIDKPIYEISKELEDYNTALEPILNKANSSDDIFNFIIHPEKSLSLILLKKCFKDFIKMKKDHEQKLAEMELTAIALAINSFASQNNKLPESMSELSKWFGKELPKNRFTNQPYELDLKGKHLLYNNGTDGIADLDSNETDDIYFDYFLE